MRAYLEVHLFSYLLLLFSSFSPSSSSSSTCDLHESFSSYKMYKSGDVILGGLFFFHFSSVFPELTFTQPKEQKPSCSQWVS